MPTTTSVGDKPTVTSITSSDFLLSWRASQADLVKITKANLFGGFLTGGGTVATGGYTLTVPATGTASLLGTAQTYSALKTFSAGLTFGQDTLNYYDEGSWTPTLTFGGGSTGMSIEVVGRYTRIGNMVQAWGRIRVSSVGSSTGAASVGGLPFTSSNITSPGLLYYPVAWYTENITFTGWLESALPNNATSFLLVQNNDGTITTLTNTAFGTGDIIYFSVNYRTGT